MSEALLREYRVCEEIGRGRFGAVSLFQSLDPTRPGSFAVKSISKASVSGDDLDSQCLLSEPKILSLLSPHPNIVQIYDVYEDSTHLHMVLDLCNGPDLHQLLVNAGRPFSESEAAPLFAQLMRAVAHCHRHGVAHRDIKPDNILFDPTGRLKLADFGSADTFSAGPLSGLVGTPYYVAPEVVAGRAYGEKVDVWSAGVVLYMMLAGFPPFYGETAVEIFNAVLRANLRFPVRTFGSVSPAAKDLLRRMLCKDISRRLSAEQALSK
ncbi:hypothetical protein CDL15_Pgr011924 [Punica granatum]|uniref:Protein kinase domain-containing protein n=1 Tax=Punica granatum TaxID=22663 RepID=A0A218WDC5_PUNGR|nr:hypothetical protein CDL15_Pgr011924 [Punica granatum]PKI36545.1 hypothetical protein CRG98_043064 [Punica granatum]